MQLHEHKVATDCSGIEAPVVALKQMRLRFQHIFSSETGKTARAWIQLNFRPQTLYGDILLRRKQGVHQGSFDGYVAGPPCQPWSLMNCHRLGWRDPRAKVFKSTIQTILQGLPRWAVVENVVAILSSGPTIFQIFQELSKLYHIFAALGLHFCHKLHFSFGFKVSLLCTSLYSFKIVNAYLQRSQSAQQCSKNLFVDLGFFFCVSIETWQSVLTKGFCFSCFPPQWQQ